MQYYSTVEGIVMTHSNVIEEKGFDHIKVLFERPNEKGFDLFPWV